MHLEMVDDWVITIGFVALVINEVYVYLRLNQITMFFEERLRRLEQQPKLTAYEHQQDSTNAKRI